MYPGTAVPCREGTFFHLYPGTYHLRTLFVSGYNKKQITSTIISEFCCDGQSRMECFCQMVRFFISPRSRILCVSCLYPGIDFEHSYRKIHFVPSSIMKSGFSLFSIIRCGNERTASFPSDSMYFLSYCAFRNNQDVSLEILLVNAS